jgi:adenine-specific DNA-methyltransferase
MLVQKIGKLELTWVGKYEQQSLEPRILLEDESKSYGDTDSGNMLIHGDNLIALKALEQDFAGKVKCIYIDPPYNTGSAFEHYEDGLEHSEWLNLLRPRLDILRNLLDDSGSIWISIDDNEYAYLRLICDEAFGRANFVCTIIWEKRKSRENRRAFSFKHDYIVVYGKRKFEFEKTRNPVPMTQETLSRYRNPDGDPRGSWQSVAITAQAGHATASQFYQIITPSGRIIAPPAGNCWRFTENRLKELITDNRIYFGANGTNVPRQKKFLSESEDAGLTPETIWYADDVGTNDSAKRNSNLLFSGNGFENPKPEELIKRVLEIASNEGDLVLDSFLGSGTTAAVAHKMGRRWIGIELGEHAYTHCKTRLDKVIDGEQGGISSAVNWQGGGGYKFYELAPSLLEKHPVLPIYQINKTYTFEMLCEAICKLEGFTYKPEGEMHGHSSENRFIHITKEFVSGDYITKIMKEVGESQSVLIYGVKIQSGLRLPDNVEVKKIPKDLLNKCNFESEVR